MADIAAPRVADAPPTPAFDELAVLVPDWEISLRARGRAASTIISYNQCARALIAFLRERGMPATASGVRREHIEAYLADMRDRGSSPANVAKHFRSLQQLFVWLTDDGEIERSPMERMKVPAVPEQPVPVLTDDELGKLLAACKGPSFDHRRDEAIVRLLLDTGMRVGELVGLRLDDVDREQSLAFVMGKGSRGRACPYGARTADALRRYLRARARHSQAARTDALLIGRSGPLTHWGVRLLLNRRAGEAGIGDVHPHMFRHTMAHRWLAAGGQETDLMRLAGWRSREMVGRYAASAADARARGGASADGAG